MDVALVRWPGEAFRRTELAERGLPRLLLLAPEEPVPQIDPILEDWARVPVGDDEIAARRATLHRRSQLHEVPDTAGGPRVPLRPHLDEHGVLQVGDRSAILAPMEARLVAILLERLGSVVGRDALVRAAWPDDPPASNTLDVRLVRLRRRLAPLGLSIRTVRKRGYLLELTKPDPAPRVTQRSRSGHGSEMAVS